jgi:hypothetical protein
MSDAGPAFDHLEVLARSAALSNGLTAGRLRGPQFQRLFRGYYVRSSSARDHRKRVIAALLIHPSGAFASHTSAAQLFGLPVPPRGDVHVTVLRECDRRSRPGIRSHMNTQGIEVTQRYGIPVSAPLDTFIALGYVLGLVDLVALGDAMVAAKLVTPEGLVAAADRSRQKGARPARRAARYVRPGVDSPMETRLRMLLVLAGLPEPKINHILRNADGEWSIRLDLSYPGFLVIIEYDGRQHAENSVQWNRDIERREELENAGWKVLVVTSKGIFKEPEHTLARVADALRRRGCPIPTKLSDAWRPHFPVV